MMIFGLAFALAACGGLALARQRLVVVTVVGWSMAPAYHPGDRVLVWRTRRLRQGQVAVSRVRHGPVLVVKRVAALPGDDVPESVRAAVTVRTVPAGKLVLIGDGHHSADSRLWGFSAIEDVLGVVVGRLHSATPVAHQGDKGG
jgi:signal peptidase I